MSKPLPKVIALLMLLEAWCFFYVALWMGRQFRHAHATWLQAFTAGERDWFLGGAIVAVALAYLCSRTARPWLRIASILAGAYGTVTLFFSYGFVRSWNVFSGDIVAVSGMSSVLLVAIGILAAVEHFSNKPKLLRSV